MMIILLFLSMVYHAQGTFLKDEFSKMITLDINKRNVNLNQTDNSLNLDGMANL